MRGIGARGVVGMLAGALLVACMPHLEPMEPIETDRPDRTEGASLIPVGMVQVEGGSTVARTAGVHSVTVGETLVRIGVHPRLELRIEPFTHTTVSGIGRDFGGIEDLALGIKTPLLRPEKAPRIVPAISLLLATSLPTGSTGFRAGGPEPEGVLAAQWGLTELLDLGANVTARHGDEGGDRYWERGASATLGLTLSNRLGSYVEWYATRDERAPNATQVINGGLTFKLTSNFQLDARLGRGTKEDGGFIGAGLATRW